MKNLRSFLPLLAVLCLLTACRHDSMEYVDFASLPDHGLCFTPYREQNCNPPELAQAVSARRDASSIDGTAMLRGLTETLTARTVRQVSGTYRSVDSWGNPVTLSGAVYYPADSDIKGIIVSCHYTVGSDHEVPSRTCFMDAWWATKGYAVVMPDYMGYGASVDSVHPYMHGELTARHVTDMILAVRPFFASRNLPVRSSGIMLAGYSQGAHAALHTLRLIEDHEQFPEYADARITVSKCCLGGGPYYMSYFFKRCVENNFIGISCGVPLLVLGMNVGRSGDSGKNRKFDPAWFFSPRLLANYEDWFLSKRYTVDQMNNLIGTGRLDSILTPEACNLSAPETGRFRKLLLEHDVPDTYVPEAPLWIFHSLDDNVVPFYNAQRLTGRLSGTTADVTCDFDHYGVHGMAFARYLLKIYQDLP